MANKKRCQIYASLPITCFEVPIIGETELNLTETEIYKCLCAKAEVIEILPDGKRMNLDFTNYNKDNSIKPIAPVVNEIPEQIPTIVEDTIEETEEVIDEVKEEQAVAETVKSYQVASRNNNYNNKKSKNKR